MRYNLALRRKWKRKKATIDCGGRQRRLVVGDDIVVDRLALEPGARCEFDRVLLIETSGAPLFGAPYIEGARVVATVRTHFRGEKLRAFKMRRRKNSRRARGHRQELTGLRVEEIRLPAATE